MTRKDRMLTPEERAHAESIVDANPLLVPIPPEYKPRILVASVVRKPPEIVQALLNTLTWQQFRTPVDLNYAFLTDFGTNDPYASPSRLMLEAFAKDRKDTTVIHSENPGGDYGEGPGSRQWTPQAWHRVGA